MQNGPNTSELERGVIIPLEWIKEHPDNPSEHTEQDIRYLRASLKRFGQVRDLVVRRLDKGYQMIAGHGMRKAMLAEGYTEASCTVVPNEWTDVQAAGYLLIDNHRASDDDRRLLLLWEQQVSAGAALDSIGVDEDDIIAARAMLAMDELHQEANANPRPRAVPDTQQHQHVKLVLYMEQVDAVEAAIKKTGLENRGEALLRICTAYLENDWIPAQEVLNG